MADYIIIGNGTAALGCIAGIRRVDPGTPITVNFARTTNPVTNGTDYRISLSSDAVSFSYM